MAKTRPLPILNPMEAIADVQPIRTPMTDGAIEELAERLIMSHEAADRILMGIAKGSELTGAEITLLRSIGIDNTFAIQRHVDRLRAIIGLQAVAGTAADRAALASEVASAESTRDEELPAIRQELEDTVRRLQARIDALESAVSLPSGRLSVMKHACERLRTPHLLPEFIRDRFDVLQASVQATFGPLRQAESTVLNRTGVLDLLNRTEPFLHGRNEIELSGEIAGFISQREMWADANSRTIDTAKFTALRAATNRELAASQSIVERDAPERAGRIAEIEATKNYYVPR